MIRRPHPLRSGFTLIEVLIVSGIIVILAALALPVLSSTEKRSRNAQCLANLRALSAADNLYATEHDGQFVAVRNGAVAQDTIWLGNEDFRSYLDIPKLGTATAAYAPRKFICPAATLALQGGQAGNYPLTRSYGYNVTGLSYQDPVVQLRRSKITKPADSVHIVCSTDLWVDAEKYWNSYIGEMRPPSMVPAYRHGDRVNVAFFDGHTESFSRQDVQDRLDRWKIK